MRCGRTVVSGKRCLAAVVATLIVLGTFAAASPQGQAVTLQGRVQWIAGEKMMLIPDNGSPPVEIDLKKASLDDYRTLTEGDPVVVSGEVSSDGTKLIARSIQPVAR